MDATFCAPCAGVIHSKYIRFFFVIYWRGEKSVQGFGGKARGKETTWKTKA
jgi:hypothetical protein